MQRIGSSYNILRLSQNISRCIVFIVGMCLLFTMKNHIALFTRELNDYDASTTVSWKIQTTTESFRIPSPSVWDDHFTVTSEPSITKYLRRIEYEQFNCSNVVRSGNSHIFVEEIPKTTGHIMTVTNWAGLGNNMFQYAALKGLADWTGHTAVLQSRFAVLQSVFPNISLPILLNGTIRMQLSPLREDRFDFNKTLTCLMSNCQGRDVMLLGFFFTHVYFDHIEETIRRDFSFNEMILNEVSEFFAKYIPKGDHVIAVAVHFRLTDRNVEKAIAHNNSIIATSYFINAMEYFWTRFHDSTVYFVLLSDDQEWVNTNILPLVDKYNIVQSMGRSGPVDLAIMAACDHAVISVGTYSWWGGWLSTGITTYYADFPRPGHEQLMLPRDTYIPPPMSKWNIWIPIGY